MKEKQLWRVMLPNGRWTYVQSHTKSEARAQAKKDFDIHDRLPTGTTLTKE